jgi:hypothetical protein
MKQSVTKLVLYTLVISLIFFIFEQSAKGQSVFEDSLPSLRGNEAIELLRKNGQYESLTKAIKQTREENKQTEKLPIEDIIAQSAKLLASDGKAGDRFGKSVAVSGNTAIVGANSSNTGNQGSVYVFVRSGTSWVQQAQLLASDGELNDNFGSSVAIDGDTIVVGADYDDVGANIEQGSAYIFTRSGTTWTQQAQLTTIGDSAYTYFGKSVAVSGNTVIVGAYWDDVGANINQGSAYIFTRSGNIWAMQAQLFAADGTAFDIFGYSVSISGETAIVGAPGDDVIVNTHQGSAYIFTRSGTLWTQQAKLTSLSNSFAPFFGGSVAISGETAIIGAPYASVGNNTLQGSAYIFTRSGTTWTEQTRLSIAGGVYLSNFGFSVAISGETVVVGAYGDDIGTNHSQGSAYVFFRSGITWTQQPRLNAADGAQEDYFGYSVAISGNNIIIGSILDNIGGNTYQGSAYVFRVSAGASISGRILTPDGLGLRNAVVRMTKQNGETLTMRSSSFGYYHFDNIEVGETIIMSVISKRFQFASQIVSVQEELNELDFIALP